MKISVRADKENLWKVVQEQMPDVPSYCGGNGRCGKCRVRLISGEATISQADRIHLTEQEIAEGYRIACQSRPLSECEVEVSAVCETEMQILSVDVSDEKKEISSCSIAVDIGTTTLVFALVDQWGNVIATHTGVNHQRQFGTDVVSRIEYAMKGGETKLTACIRKDIRLGIKMLLEKQGVSLAAVTEIVVAGNTAMEQIFFGLPVTDLGSYPFCPYTQDFMESSYETLFPEKEEWEQKAEVIPVTGLPCIAGYVGGDITAGLYEMTAERRQGIGMLLDIGTNGELACIGEDFIIASSTAAGPVFEGGNISCGMSSLPGAICATKIYEDMLECKTIAGDSPQGICGSGLIEAIADMVQLGVVDNGGHLCPKWKNAGFLLARGLDGQKITLTQTDIREFQMAKAAIAAGVELAAKEAGINPAQISEFYLAGGLGNGLSVKKAVKIGILPQQAQRAAKAVGNTSLKGAIRLLREGDMGRERIRQLLAKTRHIHLANVEGFEQTYIAHMDFRG